MTSLRIVSWLFIFVSPLLIVLYLAVEAHFQSPQSTCANMGCIGSGIERLVFVVLIYLAFLLVGIILNVIDFVKVRRTASAWRKGEIIIVTAPVWLWIFAIPKAIEDMYQQRKVDALAPYVKTLSNYETAEYNQLLTSIKVATEADVEVQNHFSNLSLNLQDAQHRINQINLIKQNKKLNLPADFSIKPFRLCVKNVDLPEVNEPWRIAAYDQESDKFHEMDILTSDDILISGKTNYEGCSAIHDTSMLTKALQKDKVLFFVMSSKIHFLQYDFVGDHLMINYSASTSLYQIDIDNIVK